MKKILCVVLKVILVICIYLLQMYVFNNSATFFGIKGNAILSLIIIITMLKDTNVAIVYTVILGTLADILFFSTYGKYLIAYIIVSVLLMGLKNIYKLDSKMSIIVFVILGVVTYEIVLALFYIVNTGTIVNIFAYLQLIFKEIIINIFLAYLVYIIYTKIEGITENG